MNGWAVDTVIIGGGAAGMMAAIIAAERGRRTLLLEHESACGRKLRITGKGRCNLCNNTDVKSVLRAVPGNPKFLYGALNRFGPAETMTFFEDCGVPLKTERGNRVFPCSDRAGDVVEALERRMARAGVRVLKEEAKAILLRDGAAAGVRGRREDYSGETVLIATGGRSYPNTGSRGDGYRMAAALGHTVLPQRPSLTPLNCAEVSDCTEMQGFSLKNVTLSAFDGADRLIYSELGELLFTHFGVSGPLVLSASAHMREPAGRWRLEIDLKPGLDAERLDRRILRDFEEFRNREFRHALDRLAGRSMIPVLLRRSGIPPETRVHSVTREQRLRLVQLFKAFPLTVTGLRDFDEAVVTAGGVATGEVNPRSMESRLVPGLFFAGEVLDVDAYTGGFNLQIAWSTGHLAGMNL